MGIFSKLFRSRQPAPPCEIHLNDRDLVSSEDRKWWNGLSLDDCKALEQEDNVFRFATWKKFVEEDGLSDADAGKKVRLTFPTYYWQLAHRAEEKFALGAADAKLPFLLKDRINRALMNRVIDKRALGDSSSFNALVRQLIRVGRM